MKKIICLLVAFICVFSMVSNSFAYNKSILDYTKNEVCKMTDEQYLTLFYDYYIKSIETGKNEETMKNELANVGVEFNMESPKTNSTYSYSTDISLNITTSRRSGQSYTYVSGVATATKALSDNGTEDMMSIEWSPSKGTYYGYAETQYTTLKSSSKRNQGLLVFNVQDYRLSSKGNYALASAKVIFNNNSNLGDLCLNYIHTFTSASVTLTLGGNVGYKDNSVTGGLSIGLTISSSNNLWERSYVLN